MDIPEAGLEKRKKNATRKHTHIFFCIFLFLQHCNVCMGKNKPCSAWSVWFYRMYEQMKVKEFMIQCYL